MTVTMPDPDDERPGESATESERPDRMSAPGAPEAPGAEEGRGETPATARPRVREGSENGHEGTEADNPGDCPDGPEEEAPDNQEPSDDTQGDDEEDERPGLRERAKALPGKINRRAARWGVDVGPPSFAKEGLPPLNASRAYAESGQQAPASGPARTAARVWDGTTRPVRWTLRLADHQLARPGRTLAALLVLAVVLRVEEVRVGLAVAWALLDLATYYTGLQWLLGVV